jgi:adsorption protein B
MRLRDRQSLLAATFLLCADLSMMLWALVKPVRLALGQAPTSFPPLLNALALANLCILAWRLMVRAAFTARVYGWREGVRAVPRAAVGNVIAVLAAGSALARYWRMRRGGLPTWGKTEHIFPTQALTQ